jgi:hypothetical protein
MEIIMPTSNISQITDIMELIYFTNPRSILDIGVGFGKYGFLSREFLELMDGRKKYNDWKVNIVGIEAFKDYLTQVHDFIYDKIYLGNVIDILPTINNKFDMILLIDVLEHFDFRDGIKILNICKEKSDYMIVSTPKDIGIQQDSFNNTFEIHKFQWNKSHFAIFKEKIFIPNYDSIICYIGDNVNDIRGHLMKYKIKKYLPWLKKSYDMFNNKFIKSFKNEKSKI